MDENTVHIGTGGPESWWRRLTKRSVLIPFFALILIGVGIWVFVSLKSSSQKKESTIDKVVKASDAAFQSGDYQKSLQQLQDATDDAKTKEEKVVLYSNMAAAAASSGNMEDAIRYLEQKHEIAPETTNQDAYLLGTYYERTENNAKAIEEYKKAIQYFKDHDNEDNRAKIEGLNARIESLGG